MEELSLGKLSKEDKKILFDYNIMLIKKASRIKLYREQLTYYEVKYKIEKGFINKKDKFFTNLIEFLKEWIEDEQSEYDRWVRELPTFSNEEIQIEQIPKSIKRW